MKQNSKHTAGPWLCDRVSKKGHRQYISAAGWGELAEVVVRMQGSERNSPEGEANARLIAAAPELLAALESACKSLSRISYLANVKKLALSPED